MNITEHEQPFPYMVIEDVFKPKQWEEIVHELKWLKSGNIFYDEYGTGVARNPDGTAIAKKNGVFFQELYRNLDLSPTYKYIHYCLPYIFGSTNNWYLSMNKILDLQSSPLVSYYENSDHYKPHQDSTVYTFLFWYFDEPKSFDGGNLIFSDYGIEVEIKPNSAVFFPGRIRHEVTEITNCTEGKGRFAVSTFISPPKFPENQ